MFSQGQRASSILVHVLVWSQRLTMFDVHYKLAPVGRFVSRLMKRSKTPDYGDRAVFGVPLAVCQQRHGQPLPLCVLYAMRRLRRVAADAVGVFRKSGVRSRVTALRQQLEADPGQFRRRPWNFFCRYSTYVHLLIVSPVFISLL